MSDRKFGWSYPPGCSGPPDDYEGPCDVCGHFAIDCICPECPVCGVQGDPACYVKHGLVMMPAQIRDRRKMDEEIQEELRADLLYCEEMAREREAEDD